MKPWNIKQLYAAYQEDLKACHTTLERQMCTTLARKEMREFAQTLTRKLTPGEEAILASL